MARQRTPGVRAQGPTVPRPTWPAWPGVRRGGRPRPSPVARPRAGGASSASSPSWRTGASRASRPSTAVHRPRRRRALVASWPGRGRAWWPPAGSDYHGSLQARPRRGHGPRRPRGPRRGAGGSGRPPAVAHGGGPASPAHGSIGGRWPAAQWHRDRRGPGGEPGQLGRSDPDTTWRRVLTTSRAGCANAPAPAVGGWRRSVTYRACGWLHLQCHFGKDTLTLARAGALVTGLDFSPAAVDAARPPRRARRGLADRAEFVCAGVDGAAEALGGRTFDIVYVSFGSLCWAAERGPLGRAGGVPGGARRARRHPRRAPPGRCAGRRGPRARDTYFEEPEPYVDDADTSYTDGERRLVHRRNLRRGTTASARR